METLMSKLDFYATGIMNKEIQNRFLEHSNPDVVYDWLERNAFKLNAVWFDEMKRTTDLMLLGREEPLIDLALALFSKNKETRNTLYDRGDSTLEKAVLTNKNCGCFQEVEILLKEENTEYLEILLTNTEERLFLVDLFKKENIFNKVKKTYWLDLLSIAARNKILEYPYSQDDDEWKDDIVASAYATRLYRSVYELFDIMDVNKNAELLAQLVKTLPDIGGFGLGFDLGGLDVQRMIRKWQNKKPVEHSDYLYFHEHKGDWDTTLDKKFTKIEGKCRTEWMFVTCRTHLSNFCNWFSDDFKKFRDSEDIALRMAYYRNEHFNWSEKESDELLENWNKYMYRDGCLFVENIIKNTSIYFNKKIRDHIGDGLFLGKTCLDEYLEKLINLQNNNPEYFVDNSQIEKIEKIESELSSLRNDVHSISIKTEENKQVVLNQRKTSFAIVFLLAVIIMLSWL